MLVIGIDCGLVRTGVAAILRDRVFKVCTIVVDGDTKDIGPRYTKLRQALETVVYRVIGRAAHPAVVAIEQPDEDEGDDGIREGREKMNIAKLVGAFAVTYAEVERLMPTAHFVGVTPAQWKGSMAKDVTARMLEAKYNFHGCANEHEVDALGVADWARGVAEARHKIYGYGGKRESS